MFRDVPGCSMFRVLSTARHDIPEIRLSTTSGNHTINYVRVTDKTIHN